MVESTQYFLSIHDVYALWQRVEIFAYILTADSIDASVFSALSITFIKCLVEKHTLCRYNDGGIAIIEGEF